MFSKKLILIGMLLASNARASITSNPVIIRGTFYMNDIGYKPSFKLSIDSPDALAYLYVKIYEDDILYSTSKVKASQLSNKTFFTSIQYDENTTKRISIRVNYYNNDVQDTVIEFDYKSPSYVTRMVQANSRIKSYNPISYSFEAYGSRCSITSNYEYFTFNVARDLSLNGRFLLLDDINYVVETTYKDVTRTVDLGIGCKFNNSGFKYELGQSILVINTNKSANTYTLRNDYDYYIDKETGDIRNCSTNKTEAEALPLFIPLSVGYDKILPLEFKVNEANMNHETYIVFSYLNLGAKKFDEKFTNIFTNKFYYQKMDNYLKGVTYNA